jgi:hypothetical protein
MSEKLLEPIPLSSRDTGDLLLRLQDIRQRVLEEKSVPRDLVNSLVDVIDDSYIAIRNGKSQHNTSPCSYSSQRIERSKARVPTRSPRAKRRADDSYITPATRTTRSKNSKPIRINFLDKLDDEPIEM